MNSLLSSEETGLPDHAVCSASHCYLCCTKDVGEREVSAWRRPKWWSEKKEHNVFTVGLCQGWQVHCARWNSNGWKALQAAKPQWKYGSLLLVSTYLHEVSKLEIQRSWLDTKIKQYIKRLRDNGTAVNIALVQAAAEGYLLSCDHTVLLYVANVLHLQIYRYCCIIWKSAIFKM